MDKVARYRQILQQVIEAAAATLSQGNQVAVLPVCDLTHDQYLLVSLGWQKNHRREHAIVFHAQLRGDQLLIETDGTEEGMAPLLRQAGFEDGDIALAWASRKHAENQAAVAA